MDTVWLGRRRLFSDGVRSLLLTAGPTGGMQALLSVGLRLTDPAVPSIPTGSEGRTGGQGDRLSTGPSSATGQLGKLLSLK